ncbi:MAG: hypothetical protein ACFFDN_34335 [Candidatus Hodarchaeota archaeon]
MSSCYIAEWVKFLFNILNIFSYGLSYFANFSWDNTGRAVKLKTQESRSIIKENGQWKILSLTCNSFSVYDPVHNIFKNRYIA